MKGKYRLLEKMDLIDEPVSGHPLIELCGNCRVLIEQHGGIMEYGPERIRIRVRFGCVAIQGFGLEICRMREKQLVIVGRIDQITLEATL